MNFQFNIDEFAFNGFKFVRNKRMKSFYDDLLKRDTSLNRELYKESRRKEIIEDIHIIFSYGALSKILNYLFIFISLIHIKNVFLFSIFIGISLIFLLISKILIKKGLNKKNYSLNNYEMFVDMLFDLEKI